MSRSSHIRRIAALAALFASLCLLSACGKDTSDTPKDTETPAVSVTESTFYGTESAIDRDSHHLGDMLRYTDTRISKIKTAFRVADLDGDRMGEILTFEDGVLTVYKRSGRNACNPVYTQTLGFTGRLVGAGLINEDLYTDLLLLDDRSQDPVMATGSPEGFTYTYVGDYTYTGGLYVDYNTDIYPPTDADHIMAYTSKDGLVWHRNLDAPCFYLGSELKADRVPEDLTPGTYENWWVSNTMEPEVLYVDGTYYMYYQCEYYQLDKSGKLMGADRIGVATSKDGIHFERKTDFPALISSDIYSCFTHQEVIYVPDDPDGLPFWMYVRYVHNNVETKRIRVRSADPTVFDMDKDYAECEGLNHIGNQLGYISDYDGKGNRLFVRMTMQDYNGDGKGQRWVPSLQFSADGVHWILSDLRMASANLDIPSEAERPNIFFLGFSTINGTGEIAKNADGKYEFFFVGGTGSSSVAPGIFYSSEGLGKVEFTVDVKD